MRCPAIRAVAEENVILNEVPGSFELPLACRYLALSGTVDAIIPVGVLIKGGTYHFEVIADTVTSGLMSVGLQTGVPILMGVLTVDDEEQACRRSPDALPARACPHSAHSLPLVAGQVPLDWQQQPR